MRSSRLASASVLTLLAACGGDDRDDLSVSANSAVGVTTAVSGAGGQGGGGGSGGEGGSTTTGGGEGGEGGAPATCEDDQQNGAETDVDCGGGVCPACAPGQQCAAPEDCTTEECIDGVCGNASCDDDVLNGGESDVDCGGPCSPCEVGQLCGDGDDCVTSSCAGGLCAAPTCNDGVQNGDETGVDCGAVACASRCQGGEGCLDAGDCESGICDPQNICTSPACDDGVLNGDESDIDCGGSDCSDCRAGQACGGGGDCVSGSCTAGQCACPANMVIVPVLGGGAYCVDQAEVTYEQYDAFMDANPQFDIPECEFNEGVGNNYTPSEGWPPNDDVAASPSYKWKPVRFVDWCDAKAYCTWANKRLCGAIEGGSVPLEDIDDPTQSQWQNACSNQGTNTYPYGNAYSSGQSCQESADGTAETAPANVRIAGGYLDVCEGGAPSLHHMSGNLAEWEDACDDTIDENDLCAVRGGSYLTDAIDGLTCKGPLDASDPPQAIPQTFRRDHRSAEIGFRCCQ